MSIEQVTQKLQHDVPNAEAKIDDAILAMSSLMTSMVRARRVSGAPAKTGHGSITRIAKAQVSLVAISGEVLRVHGELAQIGREVAGLDLHEECPTTGVAAPLLKIVA